MYVPYRSLIYYIYLLPNAEDELYSHSYFCQMANLLKKSSLSSVPDKDMSSLVDASVNSSIIQESTPLIPSEKKGIRLPERTYELEENFPCCYKPLQFFVLNRLPIIKWIPKYRPRTFISDIIAGLTVGLMVVPQALAYASIAGLPLEVLTIEAMRHAL